MKIYDILGREIATLIYQKQKPGNYEIVFDGSNLTSGIYFYRLQVYTVNKVTSDPSANPGQVFVETKKMILLR